MTDRDHFAAAALTGLLAGKEHNRDIDGADHTATAYYIADAMLRERERRVTEPMPKEKRAEVSDKMQPVAWAVVSDNKREIDCEFVYPDEATAGDVALDSNGGVVPLYAHPCMALTAAEREAIHWVVGDVADITGPVEETLRGLLERMQ